MKVDLISGGAVGDFLDLLLLQAGQPNSVWWLLNGQRPVRSVGQICLIEGSAVSPDARPSRQGVGDHPGQPARSGLPFWMLLLRDWIDRVVPLRRP